ncbi:M56 family metallopeptidase, partial [Blastomonas sp.]|uniref:M56 family metallopeptidase n=1 Tax=Blastomonas sp. TaxID=1909299 RepID=UPI003594230A
MIGEWLSGFAHGVAGEWLVDTLVATSVLMLVVLVLRRPVARYFGAEIAYLLWAVPLARLFMPPLTQTVEMPASAPAADTAATTNAWGRLAVPSDAVPEPGFAQALMVDTDWFALIVTIWLCGAAIFLITQLGAYLQNRRELLDDAVPVARIGNIRVIEIAGISGPFAFGLWRQYIALPMDFQRQYDPIERDLALAHERAHHRAGDLWANFAALAMLSLHWFNPVAWMAWRAFRFDQEAACDARVLRQRSAHERTAYARAITKSATGHTLAFASPLNPKDKIVERLKIMKQKDTSARRKWLGGAMISTGLVTAMAMTATVSYAVQPVLSPEIPEAPPAPEAPLVPEAPDAPEAPDSPVVDGDVEVYKLKRGEGKTRVLVIDRASDWADAESTDAQTLRVPRRFVMRTGSPGDQTIELGENHALRIETQDCKGKAKSDAFMTHTETKDGAVTRTKVVTCGQIMPDEAEIAAHLSKGMEEARKGMALARVELRRAPGLGPRERAEALRELDEGLR